jgi:putative methyltransferase (TIGR04325 family)
MFKKIIKYCLPIGFFHLKEILLPKKSEFEGTYETFEQATDASDSLDIWENKKWTENQLKKIRGFNELFHKHNRDHLVNLSPLGVNFGPFMLLMNLMSMKKNVVKILDFGGGTGLLYYASMCNAINPNNIEWLVCDNNKLAELGKEHIDCDYSKIEYVNDFKGEKYDVLLISSTLHYIENYGDVLRDLLRCLPSVVHLERLHAGPNTKNYIALQRQGNLKIPMVNIDLSDITSHLKDFGYELVYKGNNENEVYNDESFSDDLPRSKRVNFSISLTFIHSEYLKENTPI